MEENNRELITENIDEVIVDELSYDNENFSNGEILIDDEPKSIPIFIPFTVSPPE